MAESERIIVFDKVSFGYSLIKPILDEVDFSIRRGRKITLMGQNGSGKSTIFGLITTALVPDSGKVNVSPSITIALSRQVVLREDLDLSVGEFFQKCFLQKVYDIDPKIDSVLEVVNLHASHNRIIKSFSGGQQARLLLASALIQDPDLLLLDEPTNNLDKEGIARLTQFLMDYKKTCIVISHDANFLNSFTDGVLYLEVFARKVEQYSGNYFDVTKEITARISRENMKNAQLAKKIQENKDKSNFFANKGGQMRVLAKRMRERADEMEDSMVDVRKEDKTIRPFIMPAQDEIGGDILKMTSCNVIGKNHKITVKKTNISLRRGEHLLLKGANGSGKTTLLESIAMGAARGVTIADGIRIGYYRQDFSTLNFDETTYESLLSAMDKKSEENIRSTAAGFLITADLMKTKIGNLSEGQKGLLAFARLVLEKPGLLILDEPTNHMNFRHIPIIAAALDKYKGAMILVSHVSDFVKKIHIDDILDLDK